MTKTNASASAESQAQQTSGEKDFKEANKPEESDEIQFFDTTVAKMVEVENADGEKEWVEVLSDNLYPGEKLKRAMDDEKYAQKIQQAHEERREASKDQK